MDIRGLRYPGLISYKAPAGGGTTDYAVEIFDYALQGKTYTCFVKPETKLPMMYMPDAIRGTILLAEAPAKNLKHYSNFNFSGTSFSCAELVEEIKKHIPSFKVEYKPDYRQLIADTWPESIDDSCAREEWGWEPQYNFGDLMLQMIRWRARCHDESLFTPELQYP